MMPVIDRDGPFRVLFYANDHEPPHVHIVVKGGNRGCKVWLNAADLSRNDNLTLQEVKKAIEMVKENRDKYLEAWHGFFSN